MVEGPSHEAKATFSPSKQGRHFILALPAQQGLTAWLLQPALSTLENTVSLGIYRGPLAGPTLSPRIPKSETKVPYRKGHTYFKLALDYL